VIVWRVYSDPGNVDDTSGVDMNGHGTGVAMIAAGMTNYTGFLGVNPITEVAPGSAATKSPMMVAPATTSPSWPE